MLLRKGRKNKIYFNRGLTMKGMKEMKEEPFEILTVLLAVPIPQIIPSILLHPCLNYLLFMFFMPFMVKSFTVSIPKARPRPRPIMCLNFY
jgi:hypothetical protein